MIFLSVCLETTPGLAAGLALVVSRLTEDVGWANIPTTCSEAPELGPAGLATYRYPVMTEPALTDLFWKKIGKGAVVRAQFRNTALSRDNEFSPDSEVSLY